LIGRLDQAAAALSARSAELTDGLRDTAATETGREVVVTVAHGQILDLWFTERAGQVSLGDLRERVLQAYRAASASSVARAAEVLEREEAAGPLAGEPVVPQVNFDDLVNEARAQAGPVAASVNEFMADVAAWQQRSPQSDPADWQRDFEHELAGMEKRTEQLRASLEQTSDQVESRLMVLIVGAGGSLTDMWFRPEARDASEPDLTRDFMNLYVRGCRAVLGRAMETVGALPVGDPTAALLQTQLARLPEPTDPAPPPPPPPAVHHQSVDDLDDFIDPTNPFG